MRFGGCESETSGRTAAATRQRWVKGNQARLQLFALAYNLGNSLRRLALPRSVKHWSLTTLREKLIKIGAKL